MFDHVLDDEYKNVEMKLTGVVTYYGRHYTSFFYSVNDHQWLFFDDAHVTKVSVAFLCYILLININSAINLFIKKGILLLQCLFI